MVAVVIWDQTLSIASMRVSSVVVSVEPMPGLASSSSRYHFSESDLRLRQILILSEVAAATVLTILSLVLAPIGGRVVPT